MNDRVGGGFGMNREKALLVGMELNDRQPIGGALAVTGEGLVHVEDAGEVLGPLHVARGPERVLGETGEQVTQGPRYPLIRPLGTS